MEQSDVYSRIATLNADHPQRATLAKIALDQIYGGVAELAKLSHIIALSFEELPPPVEWPKMLYRDDVPEGREFADQFEVEATGLEWRTTPHEVESQQVEEPKPTSEPTPAPTATVTVPEPQTPRSEDPVSQFESPPSGEGD